MPDGPAGLCDGIEKAVPLAPEDAGIIAHPEAGLCAPLLGLLRLLGALRGVPHIGLTLGAQLDALPMRFVKGARLTVGVK